FRLEIPSAPPSAGVYVHENLLSFRSEDSAYQSAGAPSKPAASSPLLTRLVSAKAQTGFQSHDAHIASAATAMNRHIVRLNPMPSAVPIPAHPIKSQYAYARPDAVRAPAD